MSHTNIYMISIFLPLLQNTTFVLCFTYLLLELMHITQPIAIPRGHESLTLTFHNSFPKISNIFNVNSIHDNANNSQNDFLQNNINIPDKGAVKPAKDRLQFNYGGKTRHYPPANKEWFNSIYAYNKDTIKVLPSTDKTLNKLIKGYFDLYSSGLRKKVKKTRSRRYRVRRARLSTNRILVSRAESKHTSDKVIVTVYVYNSEKKYYFNKLKKIPAIDKLGKFLLKGWTFDEKLNLLLSKVNNYIYRELPLKNMSNINSMSNKPKSNNLISFFSRKAFMNGKGARFNKDLISELSSKVYALKSKIQLQENSLYAYFKNNGMAISKDKFTITSKVFEKNLMQGVTYKLLRKEVTSVFFKQLIRFNKLKFEDRYVSFLSNEISKIYNKKVEFNFVNLRYLYLSSSIFSSTLVAKIRNRKNRFLKVLKDSLQMFNLPPVNRQALYDEIYNKKRLAQNLGMKDVLNSNYLSKIALLNKDNGNDIGVVNSVKGDELTCDDDNYHDALSFSKKNVDILDESLLNVIPKKSSNSFISKEELYLKDHSDKLNNVISNLKHKSVKGIRIELAGRLTKRNTAARSLFKLRYKGNIKNTDSSDKGLSAVMLRGHAKSNLEFSKNKDKIRIGSYGFKGWVSTT